MTKKEFEIIYNEYYYLLFKVAYSYTLNRSDAEDIVQESFIKFFNVKKTINDKDKLKAYLVRIVVNKSIDFLRSNKNKISYNSEYVESISDDKNNGNDNLNILKNVLALKESYKTVILLHYYDNYSIKEIACILKISETNVKTRLSRARDMLREMIKKGEKDNG